MDNKEQKIDYNKVNNKPVGCFYCGATAYGKVQNNQIKWVCPRCNQLVKVGNV
jgi:hypothetical protein